MINFKGNLINIYRSCFFVTLQEQIRCGYSNSHHQLAKISNCHYKCEGSSSFLTMKNIHNPISWKSNYYSFSTLSNNRQKKSQSSQKPLNDQPNSNFQQQDENKRISQQFEKFIFDLQQIHQRDFENYEKIMHIIDKYINQKILAYSSQKQSTSSDSQSLAYFFQNEKLFSNYTTALNIKSSVDFRFRKYDEILTNIENELYLLKFLKVEDKVQKTIQKLCNMYIFVLVLHDHDKLKEVLSKNYNSIQTNDRSQDEGKVGGRKVSRKFYEGPKQKSGEDIDQHQNKKKKVSQTSLFKALKSYMISQNPQCLLSRALAFAVVGEVEQSLQLFCQLLNSDRQNKIIWENFLSVFIFFGNQKFVLNNGKGHISSSVKDFVKAILSKRDITLSVKTLPKSLSPQDAEYLLNSVLSFIKDQPLEWTDLSYTEIQQFSHSVYLIAENYYLAGEKQKAIKIIEELKMKMQNKDIKFVTQPQRKGRKLTQKIKTQSNPTSIPQPLTNLEMLTQFFQLMRLYDCENFPQIKHLQQQFSAQQKQNFYKFSSIPNDILRSNCYEIFSQTYRVMKDNEKADEYQQLSLGNHCVNNTYQINELGDIDAEIQENDPKQKDMQEKKNKGIPPHYINLSRFLSSFEVKFN